MNIILEHLYKSSGKHVNKNLDIVADNFTIPEDLDEIYDLEYQDDDGITLAADLYRPKQRGGSLLPVVVFAHGGGLFVGTRKFNRLFCEILARMGYIVYSVDYRLIADADGLGEISDICAALRFVKENAREHGGDPDKLFVCGESAGAFLSLYAVSLLKCEPLRNKVEFTVPEATVKGLIFFSGMFYTTKNDPIGTVYKKDLYGKRLHDKEFMKLMKPDNPEIIGSLPPVFMTSSLGDFLRCNTLKYAKKLEKAGHDVTLLYYGNQKHLLHAFPSMVPLGPSSAEVMTKLKKWMDEKLN